MIFTQSLLCFLITKSEKSGCDSGCHSSLSLIQELLFPMWNLFSLVVASSPPAPRREAFKLLSRKSIFCLHVDLQISNPFLQWHDAFPIVSLTVSPISILAWRYIFNSLMRNKVFMSAPFSFIWKQKQSKIFSINKMPISGRLVWWQFYILSDTLWKTYI